jgi:hypothetical protein
MTQGLSNRYYVKEKKDCDEKKLNTIFEEQKNEVSSMLLA